MRSFACFLPLCPFLVVGQMIALWLETILIGNVVQCVGLSIGCHPADGATHTECLLLSAGVLQLRLFLACNAITGLVTKEQQDLEYSYYSRLDSSCLHLPKVVAIGADVVVVVAQNACVLRIIQRSCQRLGNAEQCAQGEDSNIDRLHHVLYVKIYISI